MSFLSEQYENLTGPLARFLLAVEKVQARRTARLVLLALAFLPWLVLPPVIMAIDRWQVWSFSEGDRDPIEAGLARYFKHDIGFTHVEADLAHQINLPSVSPFAQAVPVWSVTPGDGKIFSVARGTQSRADYDAALELEQSIAEQVSTGTHDSAPQLIGKAREAGKRLSRVGKVQGRDRVPVLYHRALLSIWSVAGSGAALKDLQAAREDTLVQKNKESARPMLDRADGVLAAIDFAMGVAYTQHADTGGNREPDLANAAQSFASSLGRIHDLQANSQLTEADGIAMLDARRTLVALDPAAVWNDLLIVVAERYSAGEAEQKARPLFDSAGLLTSRPALSGTLMAIAATSGDRKAVEQLSLTGWTATESHDAPILQAIAAASEAMAGLPVVREGAPPRRAQEHGMRAEFDRFSFKSNTAWFPRVEFPGVAHGSQKSDLLDTWLFLRLFREDLVSGQLRLFFSEYDNVQNNGQVNMQHLAAWRKEVMQDMGHDILDAIRSGGISNPNEVAVAYSTLANPFFPPLMRAEAYSRSATGLPWWTIPLMLLFWTILMLALRALIASCESVFTPWYYLSRHSQAVAADAPVKP